MGEPSVFGFGIFVVLIFIAGVLYTIKEFGEIDEVKQREWRQRDKNMDIKKEVE